MSGELPPAPRPGTLLPHMGMAQEEQDAYSARGYAPTDVRLREGVEAVRLTLQGIRMGTILATKDLLERLELEAKIERALDGSKPQADKGTMDLATLLEALPTGAATTTAAANYVPPKKRGRPPKQR